MTKKIDAPTAYIELASVAGDGTNVEICCGTQDGKLSYDGPRPVAWFRSDVEGDIKFVIETPDAIVSLPLAELERAIEVAKAEVHSESFYPYPDE